MFKTIIFNNNTTMCSA